MCTGLLSSTHQPPSPGTRAAGRAEAIVIVVDSSVWIDFFHGVSTPELERLDGLLGVTSIAIGDLILGEVVQGFRQEKDGATAQLRRRGSQLAPPPCHQVPAFHPPVESVLSTLPTLADQITPAPALDAALEKPGHFSGRQPGRRSPPPAPTSAPAVLPPPSISATPWPTAQTAKPLLLPAPTANSIHPATMKNG